MIVELSSIIINTVDDFMDHSNRESLVPLQEQLHHNLRILMNS